MYHLPSTSVEGTDIDIEHMIEELNIIKNHEFFKNTEKLTPNSIDLTRNVDHAFTLEQAKESGLIQKVIKDFDDIVPEKYAEDIKASIVQEISTNILAVFEEYDDVEMLVRRQILLSMLQLKRSQLPTTYRGGGLQKPQLTTLSQGKLIFLSGYVRQVMTPLDAAQVPGSVVQV